MARGKWLVLVAGIVVSGGVAATVLDSVNTAGDTQLMAFAPMTPLTPGKVPGRIWEKAARPADAGWSEEALNSAWQMASRIGSGAILVVHRGAVVASWGNVSEPYDVFSVRKSLLHALLGPLVESGALDLDATLAQLNIDDRAGLTSTERTARVRDLLGSRSGVYLPAAYETRENAANRPRRGSHEPGEFFYYNNWDFNALGTIYERVSKGRIFEDFQERIAAPLEMEDFSIAHTAYERDRVSEHPAYLFRMTARDLARFGLLYLRNGRWRDRQIVPANWIDLSVKSYSKEAQPFSDYGYLWWVYPRWSGGLYGASGKGNQKIIIWPGRDIVVVHLGPTKTFGLIGTEVGSQDFWNLLNKIAAAAPKPGIVP